MAVIDKYKLLAGRELKETVNINAEGDEVVIRPLTNKQWAHVNETRSRGFKVNDHGDVVGDGGTATKNMTDAQNLIVSYGLVEPSMNYKEVEEMNPNIVERIANKILELTGVKPVEASEKETKGVEEEIKTFRTE